MMVTSLRERSPNYPGISLITAEEYVKTFYEKHKRSSVPMAVAAKVVGFNTVSGPAKSRYAALKQYGLVEMEKQDYVKLTDLGLTLALSPVTAPEHLDALRRAALTPPIFAELFQAKRDADDATLEYYLKRERRFSDEGATRLVSHYRASLAHAKLDSEGTENSPEEGESMFTDADTRPRGSEDSGRPTGTVLRFMLTNGKTAQVTLSGGPVSRRDFAKLIKLLEITAEDVDESEDEPPATVVSLPASNGLARTEWADSSREA